MTNFNYIINETTGGVSISGFSLLGNNVTIPSHIDNLKVESIESEVFENLNILDLIIEPSEIYIKPKAFNNCTISNIIFPDDVKLETMSFIGCTINIIKLPTNFFISVNAFLSCARINSIHMNIETDIIEMDKTTNNTIGMECSLRQTLSIVDEICFYVSESLPNELSFKNNTIYNKLQFIPYKEVSVFRCRSINNRVYYLAKKGNIFTICTNIQSSISKLKYEIKNCTC